MENRLKRSAQDHWTERDKSDDDGFLTCKDKSNYTLSVQYFTLTKTENKIEWSKWNSFIEHAENCNLALLIVLINKLIALRLLDSPTNIL